MGSILGAQEAPSGPGEALVGTGLEAGSGAEAGSRSEDLGRGAQFWSKSYVFGTFCS